MNGSTIISVGIDVGTSTTGMVVSRMTVENTAACFAVPHVAITGHDIIYRGKIYDTPQTDGDHLDIDALRRIIEAEYAAAGITPEAVDTGAVIITGESSRKENAALVTGTLSGIAGEFVVATAGPDLESVIAAKGAGAQQLSIDRSCTIANIDIGGGTSNVAAFCCGELIFKSCYDIGGRLLRVDSSGLMTYVSPRLALVAESLGFSLKAGQKAEPDKLKAVTARMAEVLAEAVGLCVPTPLCEALRTHTATPFIPNVAVDAVTFSGGVANAYYNPGAEPFLYGDIGIMLAQALHENARFKNATVLTPKETIRATVIGAGSYTTTISGSTIDYSETHLFPMKNLPAVLPGEAAEQQALSGQPDGLAQSLRWSAKQSDADRMILCLNNIHHPTYLQIGRLAQAVRDAFTDAAPGAPILVLTRADFAKVLGQAIKRHAPKGTGVICIDSIWAEQGDYLDLGRPLAGGAAVPVVVKTLIFG